MSGKLMVFGALVGVAPLLFVALNSSSLLFSVGLATLDWSHAAQLLRLAFRRSDELVK